MTCSTRTGSPGSADRPEADFNIARPPLCGRPQSIGFTDQLHRHRSLGTIGTDSLRCLGADGMLGRDDDNTPKTGSERDRTDFGRAWVVAGVIAVIVSVLAVFVLPGLPDPEAEAAPNRTQMRAHILRQLSDDQLREMRRSIEQSVPVARAAAEEARVRRIEDRRARDAERYRNCADVVYRTRNPETCAPPGLLFMGQPYQESGHLQKPCGFG